MKIIVLICLIFSFPFGIFGQKVCVSNTRENHIFIGIDNPIETVVENMNCGALHISTDNGDIIESDSCFYIWRPKHVGIANVFVSKIVDSDTIIIGKKIFRVNHLPKPTAKIAGMSAGKINKRVLAVQTGIYAELENYDFDFQYVIEKYTVIIIRSKDSVFIRDIIGNKFTEEMKTEFMNLQRGDLVLFVDIIAAWLNDKKYNINTIYFKVK